MWPILARNVDTVGPVFKTADNPCWWPFNRPPARAVSIQPPPKWALQSPLAQQVSYSFHWCWWPSVPSFRSEQVSSPQLLPCCTHRFTLLWHQKVHWLPVTKLIITCQAFQVLQGTLRLGWPLTCSSPMLRTQRAWWRRYWYPTSPSLPVIPDAISASA